MTDSRKLPPLAGLILVLYACFMMFRPTVYSNMLQTREIEGRFNELLANPNGWEINGKPISPEEIKVRSEQMSKDIEFTKYVMSHFAGAEWLVLKVGSLLAGVGLLFMATGNWKFLGLAISGFVLLSTLRHSVYLYDSLLGASTLQHLDRPINFTTFYVDVALMMLCLLSLALIATKLRWVSLKDPLSRVDEKLKALGGK